ncbi:hypothetical protein CCB80_13470 [Armatimonadetes bacterium Uphvl-Ar1]|nr:hypothetical protein CCB80_13470 [Armatimonadetes bacterium Uphvl-Ar1]
MSETDEIVERIPNTDTKLTKAFFLAFFLLFPISGIMIFGSMVMRSWSGSRKNSLLRRSFR